jgi:hypothetical protein
MEKMFKKLCTPAKIYFSIAVIASVFALFRGAAFGYVVAKLLFGFLWTYILGWLCSKGYSSISWFLVLFPYVVILLAALRIAQINEHRGIFRSVGLQGAYGEEAFTTSNVTKTTPEKKSVEKK